MTSASESLATVMPEAPAPNSFLAIPGILCVFTWGLSATPFSLATWAIFCKFLSIFGPSTNRYGVPEGCGIWSWELRTVRLLGTISDFEIHTSQVNASIYRLVPASADYEGRAYCPVGSSTIRLSATASTFRLLYSNGTVSSLAHGPNRSE